MTESIIINGVDVGECSYAILPKKQCPMKSMPYAKETSCTACKENNTRLNFCKNNPNCYFKQLKSKEQECEKYKKFIETVKSRIKGYKESCDEFCQYDRKCCHSCFTGGAIELGEDIEMDISEVENER